MMITHDKAMGTTMGTPEVPAGWLTTNEIAGLAGCSTETVIRAIHAGHIFGVRRSAGVFLIPHGAGVIWAREYVPYEGLRKEE